MATPAPSNQVALGVQSLQNDHNSGARVLATKALRILAEIDPHPPRGLSFWFGVRKCSYMFATCRPSMSSAILSVVAKTTVKIWKAWVDEMEVGWEELKFETFEEEGLKKMIAIARRILWEEVERREGEAEQLGRLFGEHLDGVGGFGGKKPLRILTLSSSSSLQSSLVHVMDGFPDRQIELRVLESRPKFEGASLATSLLWKVEDGTRSKRENVSITIAPDSHVGYLAKDVDILLLGADRISSSGDVSNKMGSLAAVLCTRALNPCAKVIIVSETDKIATPGAIEDHGEEHNDADEVSSAWDAQTKDGLLGVVKNGLKVENVYFEWIPAKYIDIYVTEEGVVNTARIEDISRNKEKLENEVFEEAVKESAKREMALIEELQQSIPGETKG
jgi:methylthioribose-1-phosphate isomerase